MARTRFTGRRRARGRPEERGEYPPLHGPTHRVESGMPRYLQRQAQANPSFAPTSIGPFEKQDRNFALTVPPIVHDVFHSSGELLDPPTREFMESRFRRDFSWVRVHNDGQAAEATDSLNAVAYAG